MFRILPNEAITNFPVYVSMGLGNSPLTVSAVVDQDEPNADPIPEPTPTPDSDLYPPSIYVSHGSMIIITQANPSRTPMTRTGENSSALN